MSEPDRPQPAARDGAPIGRRVVLGMLGLAGLGIVAGAKVQRGFATVLGPLQNVDPTGLTDLLPGSGGWRYYSVTSRQPSIALDAFQLSVTGMVKHPTTFTFDDLSKLPQTGLTRDFQCVTGWRVTDVPWRGVLVRDVLSAVGADPTATALRFFSSDGAYTESLTMQQAQRDDVLVATGMLGGPVTDAHGGPVRLYVAPMYGYKSLKWLNRIEVTDQIDPGFWEVRGYDVDAFVGRSNGRDDTAT